MAVGNKKICIFSAQYLPNVGGVERYTYNLSKKLVQKGVDVTIVASNTHQSLDFEQKEGIRIYRVPCINLMGGRFPVVIYNKKCRKLLKPLKSEKYDLVITNTRFYFHSLLGVSFGKKHAEKSIVIEHGTSHLSVHNKVMDAMERVFEHGITMIVKALCKDYYGVSEACNEWLKHFHIRAKSTLYNAIDIDQIRELSQQKKDDFFHTLGLPEDAKIVAFSGRVLPEKGIVELLEAFNKVKEKHPELYLVIAGEGPLLPEVKEKKYDRVVLLGQIPFENVVNVLSYAHVFCLPSVSEGMPTSVLEAIACKCFVITTARGGAKEIIKNKNYGIIIPDNTVKNITKSLEAVLNDENYRKQAVEESYHALIEKFTWDQVADKVIEIMKR